MPVLDAHGEQLEPPYAVPTHLETSESIGPIPHRLWAIGLAAWGLKLDAHGLLSHRR